MFHIIVRLNEQHDERQTNILRQMQDLGNIQFIHQKSSKDAEHTHGRISTKTRLLVSVTAVDEYSCWKCDGVFCS